MPSLQSCPVSDVDRALSPYIHSHQDTARIRRALSRYLTSHLRTTKPVLNHLDLECPNNISHINLKSPALRETRISYLHALEAKLKAQARHRELQQSLEDLQSQHFQENFVQNETAYDPEETRSYISLLRQRRRLAELQVIQASLERLLSISPVHDHKDLRNLVKQAIGEQPDIPAERIEQLPSTQEGDTSLFRLKKEVLEAKAGMDQAKKAKADAQASAPQNPSLEQQVFALGCSREEIVTWLEDELGKLNEESMLMEDASPVKKTPKDSAPIKLDDAEASIREAYSNYTSSRFALIDTHESLHEPVSLSGEAPGSRTDPPTAPEQPPAKKTNSTITDILPHLPCLARTTRNERALLQQNVYLQAQITAAEEGLAEALMRLSDESHLLPAGSTESGTWAKAAGEAGKATREFVQEKLLDSQQEVNRVAAIVELCSLQSKVLSSR